ncbi:unnamed protein product [Urochloa decumbens]|uniref:Uncharacterized protein n=1 Tax=Urochloa decumbens TaxID=240449 RepID=A0ABC8VNS7_9POAL
MAAEAADGGPSPPLPRAGEAAEAPAQAPEKRAAAGRGDDDEQQQQQGGGEDRPEPKRRRARARITALESVPRAAEVAAAAAAATAAAAEAASRDDEPEPAGGWDEGGGESFSFHARGFSSAQTTPKFGSFNPGAAAELVAFHLMKASRRRADPQVTEETGDHRTAAGSDAAAAAEGSDGNSR